ncbi:MAG: molybdenum cofactor synthesis domain-containing protein [Acidobacteriota bacterium]
MSVQEHRHQTGVGSVRCAVITVSDTRTTDTDTSGRAIAELLSAAGHEVAVQRIVKDDPSAVVASIRDVLAMVDVPVIITTGGTGIASRDSTYEAVTALMDKHLTGFGELFRMLSYPEIGAAAMMTRATAGVVERRAVFVLPGSEDAVRLALTRLIVPELRHVVRELSR